MLQSKRAIDRSDHLLEEIKTDDKAATNATNGMENGETSLCGPQLVLTTPLSSFRSFLPSANYAVFIIAETSKQNVTFGHGSMAGATGFAFNSEERGKEKSSKRT